MTAPLKVALEAEGRLLSLALNRPKANLIDAAMERCRSPGIGFDLERNNPAASSALSKRSA